MSSSHTSPSIKPKELGLDGPSGLPGGGDAVNDPVSRRKASRAETLQSPGSGVGFCLLTAALGCARGHVSRDRSRQARPETQGRLVPWHPEN